MIRTSVMGNPRSASDLNELSFMFLSLVGVNCCQLSGEGGLKGGGKAARRLDNRGKLSGGARGGRVERGPARVVRRAVEQAGGNAESQRFRVIAECCALQDCDAGFVEQDARKRRARVDAALGKPVARGS